MGMKGDLTASGLVRVGEIWYTPWGLTEAEGGLVASGNLASFFAPGS